MFSWKRVVVPKNFPSGLGEDVSVALAQSIDAKFHRDDNLTQDDLLILGGAGGRSRGWIEFAETHGINYLCIEKGYLNWGKPAKFRITPNFNQTLNIKSGFDDSKFKLLGRNIKPWKQGSKILIVCPSPKVIKYYYDLELDEWICLIKEEIRKYSDKEIVIREKPDKKQRTNDPINFSDIHAVITVHSMAGPEALCEGVPVFNTLPSCISNFSSDDLSKIETPYYPLDRETLFNCLSHLQWTWDEITKGIAWEETKKYFDID